MISVRNRNIVIIGAAKSGVAAARMLQHRGTRVFVTDSGEINTSIRRLLVDANISYEENGHSKKAESGDFAVVSPGVPTEAALVQCYLKSGKKVYSEIEAASWFCESPILAVTGSNGKTTTVNWLAYTRKVAGKQHLLAGNIGMAFSDVIPRTDPQTDMILEVSSFQLDHIESFSPKVSILLNITPDHLNRYGNKFENYANSKLRITENQGPGDSAIYWHDDALLKNHFSKPKQDGPEIFAFSDTTEVANGAFVRDGNIYLKTKNKEEFLMNEDDISLPGRHNLLNGLATALSARVSEIGNEAIRESLSKFKGVEHRFELVREKNGVRYYNDSKATNVNAVWYALNSFKVPVVLILGGQDKGNDYSDLIEPIREKVQAIMAIGEARQKIQDQLAYAVPEFHTCLSMEEAVLTASKIAKKGQVILLSPACASFDMFENYEARGDMFKSLVNNL
ncbi:MAG: UDP-N-acetylmuramoyl-L-alanine--D-glutamate ligase [Balneolales bacterium]